MNIGGMGSSPSMLQMFPTPMARQPLAAGGSNVSDIANNAMAEKTLPMKAAGVAAKAMTEAKGMFVDTYA